MGYTMATFINSTEQEINHAALPWHEKVRSSISPKEHHYGPRLQGKQADIVREKLEERISRECTQLNNPLATKVFTNNFLEMPGVAIAAAYLKAKKGLDNLYVCNSGAALHNKLREILRTPGDVRAAFVTASLDNDDNNNAGHKFAVCIEKNQDTLKVVVLDSITEEDDDEDEDEFDPSELKDFLGSINYTKIKIFISAVERQKTDYGCEAFALRDAAAFLQDPLFFDKLTTTQVLTTQAAEGVQLKLNKIEVLPPAYMKGTQQKISHLFKYIDSYPLAHTPEGLKTDLEKAEEIRSLEKTLQKHIVIIEKYKNGETKLQVQNHYINHCSMKYHLIALNALKMLSSEELQNIISGVLLTAPA